MIFEVFIMLCNTDILFNVAPNFYTSVGKFLFSFDCVALVAIY